ncbi:hypothetical protein EML15_06060 [Corynebacterium sp. sy017]|nr:hypothetical protein [Corynebacterium sp. sy017]QDZ43481.1 hypothetical protein FQV43_02180 [Corynebacterium sp. sy039]TSD92111.1 hypothetical protein ELY17_06060 [Corynebacterium sp. SY003]
MYSPGEPSREKSENRTRKKLQREAILGFFFGFTLLAFIQAIINFLRPNPAVFPAVLLLIFILIDLGLWRWYSADDA